MTAHHHSRSGSANRIWYLSAAALAALALFGLSAAHAQPGAGDPVDVFQDALEQDLDNLPAEDDKDRAAARKAILDFREKALNDAADKIKTTRDLSRVLRLRDSEKLRDRKNKDLRLFEIDRAVYDKVLQKFVTEFKKDAKGKDLLQQRAAAALVGDLVTNIYADQRSLIGGAVVRDMLPELARLGDSPDPGVQVAVARAMGNIILELKETLRPQDNELIRTTIGKIQKTKDPAPRRAVIDTAGALVKLLNPDAGEESIQPKIATREDLVAMLALVPILYEGMRDSDPDTRKKAVAVLYRLNSLLSRDRHVLLVTPPLSPIPAGRNPTVDEVTFINANQAALRKELAGLRQRLEIIRTQTDVFEKAILDPDAELRLSALKTLEELAILQNFVRERVVSLPQEKKEDQPKEPEAGTFFEPLFDKVTPDLVKSLSDPDPRVRLASAQVLESRGAAARPVSAALVKSLGDSSLFVRWVAARSLSRLRAPAVEGAAEVIGKLLKDEDLSVRIAAANAIESLGSEGGPAVPDLLDTVNLGDADFREAALKALGAAGPFVPGKVINPEKRGKTIVPVLAKELSNPDVRVRRAAALALGRFGADAGLAAAELQKALDDDDSEVRRYATEALLAR